MTNAEIQIQSLENYSFEELYTPYVKAFKDYPFRWAKDAIRRTFHRRGFDNSLSFEAFYNSDLVSFTRNGIGDFDSVRTAYDAPDRNKLEEQKHHTSIRARTVKVFALLVFFILCIFMVQTAQGNLTKQISYLFIVMFGIIIPPCLYYAIKVSKVQSWA